MRPRSVPRDNGIIESRGARDYRALNVSRREDPLPLIPAQCSEAGSVLGRAFRDDPIACAVLKDLSPHIRLKRLTIGFSVTLRACVSRSWPLALSSDGGIAGVALIHPPGAYPLPWTAQLRNVIRIVSTTGLYGLGRWQTWLRAIDRRHPREPHLYLEHLGVEPALQGRGLGSSLLEVLSDRANREGLACFLETANPRNLPLYRRFGFEVVAEEAILDVPTWFMRRECPQI